MNQTERLYRIEQMLRGRGVVPLQAFLDELEVSRATFKRDIAHLRDRLHAPVEWDRDAGGYRLTAPTTKGPRFELPGLWFNASEVHALLTMQELLKNLEPGILSPHVEPLRERLNALLESSKATLPEIAKRIRVLRIAARTMKLEFFELAATATLKRLRLDMNFWSRNSNENTKRIVSPQRLVFYRGNWYLDAWCHLRDGIRSFALDGIREAHLTNEKAIGVPEAKLEEFLASSYGIFSGMPKGWAKIKFTPSASRWVSYEKWHSKQRGHFEADGSYVLEVPVGDDREFLMDVLKYGPECELVEPKALRKKVAELAGKTAALYAA